MRSYEVLGLGQVQELSRAESARRCMQRLPLVSRRPYMFKDVFLEVEHEDCWGRM